MAEQRDAEQFSLLDHLRRQPLQRARQPASSAFFTAAEGRGVALGAARLCASHVALLPPRAGCAALHALALHPAGGVLAGGYNGSIVGLWDVADAAAAERLVRRALAPCSRSALRAAPHAAATDSFQCPTGAPAAVTLLAWGSNDRLAAGFAARAGACVFDLAALDDAADGAAEPACTLGSADRPESEGLSALAWVDANCVLTGDGRGRLRLWDVRRDARAGAVLALSAPDALRAAASFEPPPRDAAPGGSGGGDGGSGGGAQRDGVAAGGVQRRDGARGGPVRRAQGRGAGGWRRGMGWRAHARAACGVRRQAAAACRGCCTWEERGA